MSKEEFRTVVVIALAIVTVALAMVGCQVLTEKELTQRQGIAGTNAVLHTNFP